MPETYDSVVDRIGAFNLLAERMSKGRLEAVMVEIADRPDCWLRLVRSAESYRVELPAQAAVSEEALAELRFVRSAELFVRDVRKSERSWTVAGELEDVLHDGLGLASDVGIAIPNEGDIR